MVVLIIYLLYEISLVHNYRLSIAYIRNTPNNHAVQISSDHTIQSNKIVKYRILPHSLHYHKGIITRSISIIFIEHFKKCFKCLQDFQGKKFHKLTHITLVI